MRKNNIISDRTLTSGSMERKKSTALSVNKGLKTKVSLITLCFLYQSMYPCYANIIADSAAPQNQRPIILKDSGGNPLINIQTPNANGLSHNRYSQFDVAQNGATFNNQRGDNPLLAKGTAKLILNEVRSNSPSKLEGALGIRGAKADVIIANPSGIQVNGGSFQNAGRVTLTTGSPTVKDGTVKEINVQKGQVTIGNKGLDNRRTDYTEVLSRAVVIQGKLQANQVSVQSGTQLVDYASDKAKATNSGGSKPTVAIDVAQLGGIYANSIVLIANENGVGVKNAGTLKANNRLVLTAAGKLENSGEISAVNNSDKSPATLIVQTSDKNNDIVSTKGKLEGKNNVILSSSGNIKLSNTEVKQSDKSAATGILLNAQNHVEISESKLNTAKGDISVFADKNITVANNTDFSAQQDIELHSKNGKVKLDTLLGNKIETTYSEKRRLGRTIKTPITTEYLIEKPVKLEAGKDIKIIGNEVEVNAAKFNAKRGDVSLVSKNRTLSINGIAQNFNNYITTKHNENPTKEIAYIKEKIKIFTSNPSYINAKNDYDREYYFYYSHGMLDETDDSFLELEKYLKQLDSQLLELEEKESKLQKIISILTQKARGHEYTLSDIKGKNINLISNQGINIEGAKLNAEQKVNIYASGVLPNKEDQTPSSININGLFDTYEYGGGDHYSYAIFNNPTVINAKNGINIVSTDTKNGNVVIGTSLLSADNGKIFVQAYNDIVMPAGQGEFYAYNKYSYKSGGHLNRKYHTDIHEDRNAKAEPTLLSAKGGIDLVAGGNIDAYATVFDAPKGTINLTAGKALRLYAVDEISYSKLESHKKSRFIGISYHHSHDSSTALMKSALPSRLVAQSTNLKSGWDTVLQGTQFANTLTGAHIQAGVGEKARKDAKILLQGMKSLIQTEEHHKSSSMVWQSMSGKGEVIENLTLPTFKGKQPVFHAAGGIVVDIPKGKLKDEIVKLLAKPEYAYLKDLQTNEKINWNEVALAYDKWDYKQQGLTGAGAALIAIVVAVATYGAGSALAGTIAGTSLSAGSASAAMANAAFSSLASQASIAVINNRGNMGAALKDLGHSSTVKQLATSVVTAGVASQIISSMGLSNVTESSLLTDRLQVSLINAGTSAVVNIAVNGGKLDKALENAIVAALAETLQGEAAQYIKGIKEGANANTWYHEVAHKLAHAAVGCAAASASKGKCQDGAMGAALGEVVGEILLNGRDPKDIDKIEREKLIDKATIVVGTIAALTNKDVNVSTSVAKIALLNNTFFIPKSPAEMENLKNYTKLEKMESYEKAKAKTDAEMTALAHTLVEIGIDMTPIVGDIKGFYESETVTDYLLSTLALIPGADAIKVPLKQIKELNTAVKSAKALGNVKEAERLQNILANQVVPNTVESIYSSREVRNLLENKYGKANIVSKTVPPMSMPNVKLAGKRHPETKVPFDVKGFPIFDDIAKYDTRLDINQFRASSYNEQMRMATRDLYKHLGEDGIKKQFNAEQVAAIKAGKEKIPNYTWHHHQDTGRMQLVPSKLHAETGHIGGNSMENGNK
ncbi:DUF637 domain-containing protein [Aggregatibacter kilianii]|uniref:two-partner secretion domain-containing protein n=1 Tax=Aggregatibacter kilianii TaxID=2025884 RepID=UPI000D686BB7|nr:DUF637 domain-containing protein [Aggregatibacter kilianii]